MLVRYQVAPGCPEVSEFASKLTERAGPMRIEPAGEAAADIDVAVREEAGTFRGAIEVAARDGRQRRAIDSDNCADLVSALALSASFMLETGGAPPAPPPKPAPAPATAPAADAPAIESEPGRLRWSAGARFEMALVLTSGWALGPGAFADVRWERGSMVSPSARLSASYATTSIDVSRGSARLQWVVARAAGCPLHIGNAVAGIDPCVAFGFGAIHGEGQVDRPESDLAPWAEVDLGARAQALLWRRLILEVEASAVVPVTRYRFLFSDPTEEIRAVRNLGAGIALGAGGVF